MGCVLHKSWQQEGFYFKPQLPGMKMWGLAISAVQPVGWWSEHASRLQGCPALCLLCPGTLGLLSAARRNEGSWGRCRISRSLQGGDSLPCGNLDFSPKDWRTSTGARTILSRNCFIKMMFAHTSSVVLGPQSIQS